MKRLRKLYAAALGALTAVTCALGGCSVVALELNGSGSDSTGGGSGKEPWLCEMAAEIVSDRVTEEEWNAAWLYDYASCENFSMDYLNYAWGGDIGDNTFPTMCARMKVTEDKLYSIKNEAGTVDLHYVEKLSNGKWQSYSKYSGVFEEDVSGWEDFLYLPDEKFSFWNKGEGRESLRNYLEEAFDELLFEMSPCFDWENYTYSSKESAYLLNEGFFWNPSIDVRVYVENASLKIKDGKIVDMSIAVSFEGSSMFLELTLYDFGTTTVESPFEDETGGSGEKDETGDGVSDRVTEEEWNAAFAFDIRGNGSFSMKEMCTVGSLGFGMWIRSDGTNYCTIFADDMSGNGSFFYVYETMYKKEEDGYSVYEGYGTVPIDWNWKDESLIEWNNLGYSKKYTVEEFEREFEIGDSIASLFEGEDELLSYLSFENFVYSEESGDYVLKDAIVMYSIDEGDVLFKSADLKIKDGKIVSLKIELELPYSGFTATEIIEISFFDIGSTVIDMPDLE